MTCDEYQEQVSAMIDNELPDDEAGVLFAHLSGCAACRGSVRSSLRLRADLKEEMPPTAPASMDDKVLAKISSTRQYIGDRATIRARIWKRRIAVPMPVLALAACLLIAGGVTLYSLNSRGPVVQTVYVTTFPAVEVHGYFP